MLSVANKPIMLIVIMLSEAIKPIMLSVIILSVTVKTHRAYVAYAGYHN